MIKILHNRILTRQHLFDTFQSLGPAPPLISPRLHSLEIFALAVEFPARNTPQLEIDGLQVRIRRADERLPQVIEAVPQVMRIRSFVVIREVLHIRQRPIQSGIVPHPKDILTSQYGQNGVKAETKG